MNNAEKNLLIKKLKEEDDEQLASTLHYYREHGDIELLPNVLELLSSKRSADIKNNVLQICADIKTQEAATVVFNYMASLADTTTKKSILSTLWQTGMDFSDKAAEIVDLIIGLEDFESKFDALTLLENCALNISKDIASDLHSRVKTAEESAADTVKGILGAAKSHLLQISLGKSIDNPLQSL